MIISEGCQGQKREIKKRVKLILNNLTLLNVGRGGFEPPKALPTDLQSAPFDRFGISPRYFLSRISDSN